MDTTANAMTRPDTPSDTRSDTAADTGGGADGAGRPWPAGAGTGVGSLPGTDIREAVRTVLGELPDLPHLPELPARGVGADLTGRTVALLTDVYAEVQPSGWRIAGRPGRDHRRAVALLGEDLDALEEFAAEHDGALKVQVAGPWTVAATVELRAGDRALADGGACRDLAASLAEGLTTHLADIARRVPKARMVVQLDEPALPGVLRGSVPTASGFGRIAPVEHAVVVDALRTVVEVVHAGGALAVVHCCAAEAPLDTVRRAGADGVGVPVSALRQEVDEEVGRCVEDGMALFAGAVPALDAAGSAAPRMSDPARMMEPVRASWHRIGFPPAQLARDVVPTPTCGLAGASPAHARAAMTAAREAGRSLLNDPEG